MGAIIPKLRASARGQTCTLQTPFCNHDPETTVLAHLPSEVAGRGTKSDDYHACFSCSECHLALDQHRLDEHTGYYMLRGLQRTIKFWIEHGYLVTPGVLTKRPKPSTKTVQRSPLYVQGS